MVIDLGKLHDPARRWFEGIGQGLNGGHLDGSSGLEWLGMSGIGYFHQLPNFFLPVLSPFLRRFPVKHLGGGLTTAPC